MSSEQFNPIEIGIVNDLNYKNIGSFNSIIESISKENEDQVFKVNYYQDEESAVEALKDNNINGYYIVNEKIEIIVKNNGLSQTIMKYVADNYYQTYSVIENIYEFKPSNYKYDLIENLNNNESYFESASIGKVDMTVLYFYSLIGMICLYGAFFGIDTTNATEANLNKKAARGSIAPTNKLKTLLLSSLAAFIIHFIEILILLSYLILILKIDFSNHLPYVFLMVIVGSLAGISMGTLIGSSNKKGENFKITISLSVTMICSFLAGMMMDKMKYTIANNAPILARINPVTMITDGLYSLYYYDNLDRYFMNLTSLIIFSVIMIIASYFFVRRKKYDSI